MLSRHAEAPMQQFNVASFSPPVPTRPPELFSPSTDLLRQLLEVQKQHLAHAQAVAAANDTGVRWRAMVTRWREQFPDLLDHCKEVLPVLERAYGSIIASMVEEIRQQGEDALDNEFALQDFLDRFGMRLGQLGNILNLVSPLAETAARNSQET
jgi:hypothetical protein